jgi:hypothetical protein
MRNPVWWLRVVSCDPGLINYHFMADRRGVQQVISLGGAEIFDCFEGDYLGNSSEAIMRRHIVKKFDFNLFIREDMQNNISYTISASNLY